MVSAKFHLMGEESDWFRIRLQEEIYAHGLEGSVLVAEDKTLVVVVEGDKTRIKKFHVDVSEFLPEGIQLGKLAFSLQKGPRRLRIKGSSRPHEDSTIEYILQYLREIEKNTQRLDQKMNALASQMEQVEYQTPRDHQTFEEQDMEVEEEAAGGFAAMFGDYP